MYGRDDYGGDGGGGGAINSSSQDPFLDLNNASLLQQSSSSPSSSEQQQQQEPQQPQRESLSSASIVTVGNNAAAVIAPPTTHQKPPKFYDSEADEAGGSLVFITQQESHGSQSVYSQQQSPPPPQYNNNLHQQHHHQSSSNTISSNASVESANAQRNLFLRDIEQNHVTRRDSSGSVVIIDREENVNENDNVAAVKGRRRISRDNDNDIEPQLLLPYQQRKELSRTASGGEEFKSSLQITTPITPTPLPPTTNAISALKKYSVQAIPPFRGGGGGGATKAQPPHLLAQFSSLSSSLNNSSSDNVNTSNVINSTETPPLTKSTGKEKKQKKTTMEKVKSAAVAIRSSSRSSSPKKVIAERTRRKHSDRVVVSTVKQQQQQHSPVNDGGNRPPRAPLQQQHQQQQYHRQQLLQHSHHDVIDPNSNNNFPPSFPPIPPPYSLQQYPQLSPHSTTSDGGSSGGYYHIRIRTSSGGSISSLGSDVGGVDDGGGISRRNTKNGDDDDDDNSSIQQSPNLIMRDSQPQKPPPPPPPPPYRLGQEQQQGQGGVNYSINYNAILGREVADFLHGEVAAKAAERRNQQLQKQQQQQEQLLKEHHCQRRQQLHDPYGLSTSAFAPPPHPTSSQRSKMQQHQHKFGWYGKGQEHIDQHIHIFTPPDNDNDDDTRNLLLRESYSSSEIKGEAYDYTTSQQRQQQQQMQLNHHGQHMVNSRTTTTRGYYDPSQILSSNTQYQYQHGSDRLLLPTEKSSLLHSGGGGGDYDYDMYGIDNNATKVRGHGGVGNRMIIIEQQLQHDNDISSRRRKKEKKRHHMFSTESSEDEEISHDGGNSDDRLRRTKLKKKTKKDKSKGKSLSSSSRALHHRKQRSNHRLSAGRGKKGISMVVSKFDDSLTESYSESYMGSSVTESSRRRQSKSIAHRILIFMKLFVSNLPLSFSGISFSIALLGILWLKYAKENLPSCKEVNFHSSQCAFPEFPGCYFCDEYNPWYRLAIRFHDICSCIAGISVLLFFVKAILCWRVFIDDMSSPTTSSPSGLIFMTLALSAVGQFGNVGIMLVFIASSLHLVLVIWFIYMSLAYQTMPDPSWFANTIGIGLCAVKIWFYYPLAGHFLIAVTFMLTFVYYPISLIRVALNEKISATTCFLQSLAPSVGLYSLAIIMQPTFMQERPDISHFQTVQRSMYLPAMTCLFALCVIGMISSIYGLMVRWKQIAAEEFSPAHAAYSFPVLMHAMAIQSYRSSLNFFAPADAVSAQFKSALHIYWMVTLVTGTLIALICIILYLTFLSSWVDVDTSDKLEPPAPNEITICNSITYGESLIQPYVSPTILQANETGNLMLAYDYDNDWCDLVRTRRMPAFGFEPMLSQRSFRRERMKLFMGWQEEDAIQEGNEEADCLDNEIENDVSIGV